MPEEHARRSNLYVDDELYVWEENAETLRYVAGRRRRRCTSSATSRRGSSGRRRRSSPSATPEAMDALRDELQPLFGSRAFVAKSLPYFLEFAAPGVSKASGLALVADLLGFTAAQAIAVGDAENDREMLDWAGFGAGGRERRRAPAAARPTAVIPSVHDDGVAQLLEALADARRPDAARLSACSTSGSSAPTPSACARRSRGARRTACSTRCSRSTSAGARCRPRSTSCAPSATRAAQAIGEAKRAGRDAAAEIAAAAELRDRLAALESTLREADAALRGRDARAAEPPARERRRRHARGGRAAARRRRRAPSRSSTSSRATTSTSPARMIDVERGARTSGSRFAYLLGDIVRLHLATRAVRAGQARRARASRRS